MLIKAVLVVIKLQHRNGAIANRGNRMRKIKKASDAKREWQDIFHAIGQPAFILEPDHSIIACNKAVMALMGKPMEYFIGKKCCEVFHNSKNPPKCCPMEKLLKSARFETVVMNIEALDKIFRVSCTPVFDETGKLNRIIHIATDITEQKEAESEAQRYKDELLKLRRSTYLDLLNVMIGHHLSQPLTVMNMRMDSALKKLKKGKLGKAKAAQVFKTCLHETRSATGTIQKMREHTRQWLKGRTERFNASNVIRDVIQTLESKAANARMIIELIDTDSLPAIKGNRNAFEQVVLNLSENAIEAADRKRQHRLIIKAKKMNECVEMTFSDDCCGIAKENLKNLFEPFYSTKAHRGSKCLGLGLPIVHRMLMVMGGSIRVESRKGKGTTFYINWPLS